MENFVFCVVQVLLTYSSRLSFSGKYHIEIISYFGIVTSNNKFMSLSWR